MQGSLATLPPHALPATCTTHMPPAAAAPTCEHNLARHEDEQHDLGLLHAVDEAGEQLRLILQQAGRGTGG